MKPYYETENGVLYLGDCLTIMPQLEPADLVLTDPNYGIGEAAGKNKSRSCLAKSKDYGNKTWDNKTPPQEAFDLMISKSKNQIIFGGNYFIEYLKNSPCWLVWDKKNGNNDFADCELAWTSFKKAVRKYEWMWHGMIKEVKETRYHPTQKPVGLFMKILTDYAKAGQSILDPFAGSGTTALACEELKDINLSWILIEQDEEYCEIAAKRIERETKQLKLF